MRFIYTIVRERLKRAATAAKRYYDRKACLYSYKEGDPVRVKRFRLNKGTRKFEDYYEGPFFIIDVLGATTFRLAKCPTSPRRVLTHDALLPYHSRDAADMAIDNSWVFPISRTWRSGLLTDSSTQTEPVELPESPVEAAAASDNELPGDSNESTQSPPADSRYNLRSRAVPRTLSPSAPDLGLDKQPRKRGRPRKTRKEDFMDSSMQTNVHVAARWTSE